MKILHKIDDFLIDRVYQRISDFIWDKTEMSCFKLARISLVISQIAFLTEEIFQENQKLGWIIFGYFLVTISLIGGMITIKQFESLAKDNFANIVRVMPGMIAFRLYFMAFTLLCCFSSFFQWVYPITLASSYYFVACQKRPPAKKKVKIPAMFANVFS
jgi:hypothetical protein